jgi:hypothetical protein
VVIAKDTSTYPENQRGVTLDEEFERRRVAVGREPVQEVAVGRVNTTGAQGTENLGRGCNRS